MPLTSRSAGPAPLEHRVADLPDEGRHAGLDGTPPRRRAMPAKAARSCVAERHDVVVEVRDGDAAVATLQRAMMPARSPDSRRRRRTSRSAGRFGLPTTSICAYDEAAQADRDRRLVALVEAGVADEREVGLEAVVVVDDPLVEVVRPRLLLALEDDLEVDRQLAARLEPRPAANRWTWIVALVVRGDAPSIRSLSTTGSKGGRFHRSSGSTGWTS